MADHNPSDEEPQDDGVFDDGDPPTDDANVDDGLNPYDLAEPVGHGDPTAPPPPAPILQAPEANILRCQQCQQDLTGATLGGNCPSCGAPIVAAGIVSQQSAGNAVASLVLGILSLPTCFCCYGMFSVILGGLAVHFGRKAKQQIANGTAPATSEGMAHAGFICGVIGLSLGCILALVYAVTQILAFALEF